MKVSWNGFDVPVPPGFRPLSLPARTLIPESYPASPFSDPGLVFIPIQPDPPSPADSFLSYDLSELAPDRYPLTLTLSVAPDSADGSPLLAAHATRDVLAQTLPGFRASLVEPDARGSSDAARLRLTFGVHFTLNQLVYFWKPGRVILAGGMVVRPRDVRRTWTLLRRLAQRLVRPGE
jgi:hypothetical protein